MLYWKKIDNKYRLEFDKQIYFYAHLLSVYYWISFHIVFSAITAKSCIRPSYTLRCFHLHSSPILRVTVHNTSMLWQVLLRLYGVAALCLLDFQFYCYVMCFLSFFRHFFYTDVVLCIHIFTHILWCSMLLLLAILLLFAHLLLVTHLNILLFLIVVINPLGRLLFAYKITLCSFYTLV